MEGWPHKRVSLAHLAGVTALAVAALLAPAPTWPFLFGLVFAPSIIPLALFLILCGAGPFYPQWSAFLPVICRGPRDRKAITLTFDDGPDPLATPALLDLLKRHGVRASFFLVGKNAQAHPDVVRRIRDAGHEVGNHSMSHDPMLMFRSIQALEREVAECQEVLRGLGVRPLAFRPPVGITNSRLGPVLRRLGLGCVCFSCRPLDFGNRRIDGLAERVLGRLAPGDIVLLHDVFPEPGMPIEGWLGEVERIVVGARERGFEIVPLSELVGRPLMEGAQGALAREPVLTTRGGEC